MGHYGTDSKSYLNRARLKLDSDESENLFYACFELRCGIESRMREYLEPYDHISKKDKNSWNLNKLNKACEKYFDTNQKKQKVTVMDRDSILITLYYIPVPKRLIELGQKLGNYLHDMKEYKSDSNNWWSDFKDELEECYALLAECCKGNLNGPMLVNSGKAKQCIDLTDETKEFAEIMKQAKGKNMQLKVEYV